MNAFAKNQPIRGNVTSGMERILDKPRASVYQVGAASFPSATIQVVTWDTEDWDTDGMWDANLPTRLTAKTAGLYSVCAWFTWASDINAYRRLFIAKNGAGSLNDAVIQGAGGAGTALTAAPLQAELNAGDYLEVFGMQGTAGALASIPATSTTRENGFQACLIST